MVAGATPEVARLIASPEADVELLRESRRCRRLLHQGTLCRTICRVAVGPARAMGIMRPKITTIQ